VLLLLLLLLLLREWPVMITRDAHTYSNFRPSPLKQEGEDACNYNYHAETKGWFTCWQNTGHCR
jgi:hypothetical protein